MLKVKIERLTDTTACITLPNGESWTVECKSNDDTPTLMAIRAARWAMHGDVYRDKDYTFDIS